MSEKHEENLAPDNMKYATFSGRMLASIIDTILSSIVLVPIFNIFNKFFGVKASKDVVSGPISSFKNMSPEDAHAVLSNSLPSLLFQTILVAVVVVIFWRYSSATPGKIFLKMKIVDAKTGLPPSNRQLIVRYLGYFVSLLTCCMGFVWIYYDKRHQGFHDKMAGTVVVVEEKTPTQ